MRKQSQRNVTVLVGLLFAQALLGASYTDWNGGEVTLWRNKSGETKAEMVNGVTWTYSPFDYDECDLYDFTSSLCNLASVVGGKQDTVRVPDFLNGKPVVAIGKMAFTGCNINKLIIPEGIKKLDWTAFLMPTSSNPSHQIAGKYYYIWYLFEFSTVSHILFEGDLPQIVYPSFKCKAAPSGDKVSTSWTNGGHPYGLVKNTGDVCWVYKECKNYVERYGIYTGNYSNDRYLNVKIVPYAVASPCDGTVISDTVDVSLSCATEGANIYYTTDGSEPSEQVSDSCFKYDGTPVRVATAGTIKTLVKSADCPFSKVYSHSYAQGCAEAVGLDSRFGNEFYYSSNKITLSCADADAVIRYSTDGTEVSEESDVYIGPFTISDTTMVRAKAYKTNWFPSDEIVQVFTRKWYETETPVISAESAAFDGALQAVAISCATEGATVYYTIDGSEPSAANGRVYKGPFNIYDSVTVKAIAVKDDWKDSAVASAAFTKNNGLSAAINMYDYLPDNDANCPWTVDKEVSHDGVSSARSGAIGENGVTTMKVTVRGAGRLSFWWKSECEAWDEDYYDYGAFCVGSEAEPRLRIAGMTDWKREEVVFDGTGKHVCKWEYHKDDAESIPRDCIWVDQVQWLPYGESEHDHTLTTEVPVPYLWLDSYGLGRETDFEAAAKMKLGKVDGAGRAMSVEDDYVAGTDPTNLESKLTATIKMGPDGKPIVSWKPPLNGEDADGAGIREGVRKYSVFGKRDLADGEEKWELVAEGEERNYRFFKVEVGMP